MEEGDYPRPPVTYPPDELSFDSEASGYPTEAPVEGGTSAPTETGNFLNYVQRVEPQTSSPNATESPSSPNVTVPAMWQKHVAPSHPEGEHHTRGFSNPSKRASGPMAEGTIFYGFPKVKRNVFSDLVQLKAHSSFPLGEKEPEIFAVLQSMLTPYLQHLVGPSLHAYNLEVVYTDGDDASQRGVIVTEINVTCTLSIESDSYESLTEITHEKADEWIHHFFTGSELYQLLGELRRNGVDVNEIVALDQEFRSPIFQSTVAGVSTTNSKKVQGTSEPKSSKAGMLAAIFVGMFVVAAVFFANKGGRLPGFSSQEISQSIRNIREAFSSDSESQSEIEFYKDEMPQTRARSWSGSFRRHPPGGIRPAAIQKHPAYSKAYLSKVSPSEVPPNTTAFDDQSFSVAGDFNIPEEYDFKQSPMSDVYSLKVPPRSKPWDDQSMQSSQDEEFSMPEDYNTVNEDLSVYSKYSQSVMGNSLRYPRRADRRRGGNPFESPLTSPSPSQGWSSNPFGSPTPISEESQSGAASPTKTPSSDSYIDEWSVASFNTPSPSADKVPYRHWNEGQNTPNSRSQLDMPPLA